MSESSKAPSISKTERILNLISCLLKARQPVPWKEIAGKVVGYDDEGVQSKSLERRFERDKQALKEMGLPIRYVPPEEGEQDGYVIPQDACFMKPMELLPHEMMLINIIGEAAMAEGDDNLRRDLASALRKIRFDDPEAFSDLLEGDAPRYVPSVEFGDSGQVLSNIEALSEAVLLRHRVRISYSSVENPTPTPRDVNPYGLGFHEGSWYLVGHCHLRGGTRCFKVSRIAGEVQRVGEGEGTEFAIPEGFHIEKEISRPSWQMGSDTPVRATVRLSPHLAWRVDEEVPRAIEVRPEPDGSAVVVLDVLSQRGFLRWALRRLRHVEVLAPADLAGALAEEIRKVLALYRFDERTAGRKDALAAGRPTELEPVAVAAREIACPRPAKEADARRSVRKGRGGGARKASEGGNR